MALTDKEKQKAFRDRMHAAGYKGKLVWVPRDPDGKPKPKMNRNVFIRKVDELTVSLSPTQLSKVLKETISFIKELTGN
ncbi:hypothetical protein FACS1894190_00480 [Spirochaetia bacterium]|nr:hypothetical protein FACS1894190_00480 [Spirochaetia bacterium]